MPGYGTLLTSIVVRVRVRRVLMFGRNSRMFGLRIISMSYLVSYRSGACRAYMLAMVWWGSRCATGMVTLVCMVAPWVASIVAKS